MRLLFLLLLSVNLQAQTLVEDKIDDFTKNRIKRTSWEILFRQSGLKNPTNIFYNVSKVDSVYGLTMKIMLGNVFSIDTDDELMIKLENDSVISLHNYRYTISKKGGGSIGYWGSAMQGLTALYEIDNNQYKLLLSVPISKIRIALSRSQIDLDINPKNANSFIDALLLLK